MVTTAKPLIPQTAASTINNSLMPPNILTVCDTEVNVLLRGRQLLPMI